MKIYLVASGPYWDAIIGDGACAKDEAGIVKIISGWRKHFFYEEVRHVRVDFTAHEVTYEYKPSWEDDWEQGYAYLFELRVEDVT